ncbi:MAG: ABC transporter permease [Caldilineaceae bacterium]|nr:ABC transporter permease [Caldilineaceae bacterium]
MALYAVITMPLSEAVRLWRGGEDIWQNYPRTASPSWTNYFTRANLPSTILLDSRTGAAQKVVETRGDVSEITLTYTFNFQADAFPPELAIFFNTVYRQKQPHVEMTWQTPDGREIRIGEISPRTTDSYRFEGDSRLARRLRNVPPQQALFAVPDVEPLTPLKGTYTLTLNALVFEEGGDVDARFVSYGRVHGIAGTDHRRRDLSVAILWGTPIALAFGLLAALGTTLTTMFIAAFGVWFGSVVDAVIQRLTEVVLILPLLPILIMVGTFYSRSIWVILGVVILLSIFGAGIKSYRAIFLQVKESPYIEAARAYGAGNLRIIVQYMIPRIIPLLIPQLVVLIPSYVFLEASLAVLGLGDPVLPTWGKVIDDASRNGALFNGYYYWVLQPAALLIITGLGFAMVGFALDRVFNPRLRGL